MMAQVKAFSCTIRGQHHINIVQHKKSGLFTVTYGKQVIHELDYEVAAKELGLAILHALACAGRINA